MKIIDLLNKIANGEDVPKEIKYRDVIFRYDCYNQCYIQKNYDKYNDLFMQLSDHKGTDLNYEIEIIEEETKPLTKKDIEALGYACGEIQKCFTNGWKKSLENKPFKEDKKIEKLPIWATRREDKEYTNLEEHILVVAQKVDELIDKVNNMENNK